MAADRKSVDKSRLRVPPEALMTVYLDEISSRLATLIEMQKQQTPRGVSLDWTKTVTDAATTIINFLEETPYTLLHRVEIINKGTEDVHVKVEVQNAPSTEITIEPDEAIPVDVKRAAIESVELRVAKDTSTTVKIVGLY